MQKIIFITNYKQYKSEEITEVPNNTAHFLIEQGVAMIYNQYKTDMISGSTDKMMRPETRGQRRARQKKEGEKKGYETK